MHITLETDYAIRITQCIANQGKKTRAKDIAKETGITERFILKILRQLVNAGIMKSFKGVNGGYVLARPADQITLRQVMEAVQGPIVINRCQLDPEGCSRLDKTAECGFHKVFNNVTKLMTNELGKITFAVFQGEEAT